MQLHSSPSPGAGMSCHPSTGLQVDGEQQRVQGAQSRKRELLPVGAAGVLPGKKKKDWQSCSSESLFRQCHICKAVTNYAWLCLKAAEMLSREMGFLSIAIKISSFSAVDSLIATSGWWRALWSAATVLLTRAGASLQMQSENPHKWNFWNSFRLKVCWSQQELYLSICILGGSNNSLTPDYVVMYFLRSQNH